MSNRATETGQKATALRYGLMDLAARRDDVISLGRGDPDIATPAEIIEGAAHRMSSPVPAVPILGLVELRQRLAQRYRVEKGMEIDPERQILITNGGQEGLFLTLLALVDPGDGVAMADPRYSSYDQAVGAAGGRIVEIPTGRDLCFELGAEAVREAAVDAKVLVLVNPSNPTSAFIGPAGVREIAQAARDRDLIVVADEIYEDLVYDDQEVLSIGACDGMSERTVTLSGFSKAYAMTGFRVGYLIGTPDFVDAVAAIKRAIAGPCPLFSQYAALSALQLPGDIRGAFRRLYDRRRRLILQGLDTVGIPYGAVGGGLFVWADVSLYGLPAEEFCLRLLQDTGVLMFPGRSFGERWEYFVRISLLAPEAKIVVALERLATFVTTLPRESR
ncbi:MAG TPA: pyridoxal phosphate-dependent aminotransferase [Acidobacteriota bacterium]|nr:pyridoxal phosphate-dependent aminotransferase [Acidobacteriota bacterium]